MGKTVLILGNGFDLAHELPTKYSHFLDFCDNVILYNEAKSDYEKISWFNDSKILNLFFDSADEINNSIINEILRLISNNIWYKYLSDIYKNKTIKGENWIDFESEISEIIQFLDKNCNNLSLSFDDVDYYKATLPNIFASKYIFFKKLIEEHKFTQKTIRDLRKILYDDLLKLSSALRIYLHYFVEKMEINTVSPDLKDLSIDYVINFNYTDTFQRIYDTPKIDFHIHGDCSNSGNNLVLGIDEYWSKEDRDEHTNFTIFKKFAQRIQKRTGIEHIKMLDEIELEINAYGSLIGDYQVYVFGHSLDKTDKDILKKFMKIKNCVVTVFCLDSSKEGEYIANMIKIIGEDNLIKRANSNPPTIKFVIQQPMQPLSSEEKNLVAVE